MAGPPRVAGDAPVGHRRGAGVFGAMDLSPEQKQRTVGGLLWLAIFFAGMLAVDRSFAAEREEGCWEGLLLYPVSPAAIYLAKLAVNVVALAAVQCVLIPLFVVLTDVPLLARPWPMLLVALLGNLGIAALGTLVERAGRGGAPQRQPVRAPGAAAGRSPSCWPRRRRPGSSLEGELGTAWWRWVQLLAGSRSSSSRRRNSPFRFRRRGVKPWGTIVKASGVYRNLWALLAAASVAAAILAIFLVAPTEETMGQAQRILYVHVAVAWLGLAGFIVMAAAGGDVPAAPRSGLGPLGPGGRRIGLALLGPDPGHRIPLGPCRLEYLVDLGPQAD